MKSEQTSNCLHYVWIKTGKILLSNPDTQRICIGITIVSSGMHNRRKKKSSLFLPTSKVYIVISPVMLRVRET